MKDCSYCAEKIQDKAIKCRYCGEDLNKKESIKIKDCPYCAEKIEIGSVKCEYCGENLKENITAEEKQKNVINEKTNIETNNNSNKNYKYQSLWNIYFILTHKGRINRLQYFLGLLSFYGVIVILILIDESNTSSDLIDMLFLLILPAYYFLITIGIRRSHDINNSGWYILIPFYTLYLFFAKGNKGENRFG